MSLLTLPGYSRVLVHPDCLKDLQQLLDPGQIPAFLPHYQKRVKFLSDNLGSETQVRAWFEVLKNSSGKRSIRFLKLFGNLRIIYMIVNQTAVLLVPFQEHIGHASTEYAAYLPLAEKRLLDFKEGKQ